MRVLVKGHRYELDDLKSSTKTILQFYQDGDLHGERINGPSCQEVIRALIDRVQSLHDEKPDRENEHIIRHLRCALVGFEGRALRLKAEKGEAIELYPTESDGHLL